MQSYFLLLYGTLFPQNLLAFVPAAHPSSQFPSLTYPIYPKLSQGPTQDQIFCNTVNILQFYLSSFLL